MGRLSPVQLTQTLVHQEYSRRQQGSEDDPLPEMDE